MSYTIKIPSTGGKAGKGLNKTGSVQVLKDNCIVKQFRFRTDDRESINAAGYKAADFVDKQRNG